MTRTPLPNRRPHEGRKDDTAKPRMDLIPPELLEGVADVLTYGAAKYAPRNWEHGMAWGRVFAALPADQHRLIAGPDARQARHVHQRLVHRDPTHHGTTFAFNQHDALIGKTDAIAVTVTYR